VRKHLGFLFEPAKDGNAVAVCSRDDLGLQVKSEDPHPAKCRPELMCPDERSPACESIGSQAFVAEIVRDEAESAQNAQEARGRDRRREPGV
jgi:hypothetical protein